VQTLKYPAVRFTNKHSGKSLVLFGASAVEINNWVGVPQKLKLGEEETAGFQRTVSTVRRNALEHFFSNPQNIMQNPLLCAIRKPVGVEVSFTPLESDKTECIGTLSIKFPELSSLPLKELFRKVRLYLEERVPDLSRRPFPDNIYKALEEAHLGSDSSQSEEQLELLSTTEESTNESLNSTLEEALFEDSQIVDFWDQIKAREELANRLENQVPEFELAGFRRDVLEAYLRPVILVDGQHRLAGAVAAARSKTEQDAELKEKVTSLIVNDSIDPEQALQSVMAESSKMLPVSLLLDDSPAEHVFQFVVVNQKATPVPKALLGTIISTSLAATELSSIKERLVKADIPLESSQTVSSLATSEASPFAGKVARGFEQEANSKLPWTVLATLAEVFRSLKGAKYFHEPSLDQADVWKMQNLESCEIIQEWQARDYESPESYWQDTNGPWREVFISFWIHTRDKLANTDNPDAPNYWGNPRTSNIFNKPSLFILSTDFFSFLREQRATINDVSQIKVLVDEWLRYVSPNYFNRDWKLSGVKKDSVGTRRQWSYLWFKHRSSGATISPQEFQKIRRD
jgi:hypothetical protein